MSRLFFFLITAILITGTAQADDFEPMMRTVPVATVLNQDLIKGDLYTVSESVTVDGYMNYFQVESDFGPFNVVGNLALRKLLKELDAIAELKKMTSVTIGTTATVNAVADTGRSVITLVTSPVESVKGISHGVSRLFKRTSKTVKDVSDKGPDDSEQSEELDEQDESEALEEPEDSNLSSKAYSSFMGVGKAHRELAQKLNVDPYSDNAVLQAELNRVANISGSVGKVTKIILPIPSLVSTAASASNMIWHLSPTDLLIQNRETLKTLGYEDELIEAFFSNTMYTPSMQTAMVFSLGSFTGIKGTAAWLEMAVAVQTTIESKFVVQSMVLTQRYHEKVAHISEFISLPNRFMPAIITDEGNGLIVAALDQLSWTEDVLRGVEAFDILFRDRLAGGEKLLWAEGQISDLASGYLQSRGWEEFTMPLSMFDIEVVTP